MSGRDPVLTGASVEPAPSAETTAAPELETALAGRMQELVAAGNHAEAREVFGQIVSRQQRRASRIAWHYLRDAAEADEAVQDAFVKAFTHIASFQRDLSFEIWFTRILVNGCLDRRKAQSRRARWLISVSDAGRHDAATIERAGRPSERSPEQQVLAREWREQVAAAVRKLPGRQRLVFLLCHCADHTTRDVAEMTGLNESTVRVHLFRAIRKLRAAMEGHHHAG
jgi:RNA polymerase sigma-70 factor, ECF subfamily